MADDIRDDGVQHGIDDNPNDDGKKGLELGALGGGTVGAMAGMAAGPVGAVVGALVGGTVGSIASGAAVDAVDSVDNDNTITGIGSGATTDIDHGLNIDAPGNNVSGVQTGGVTTTGADTRGVTEKAADVITGDPYDDKTGGVVVGGPDTNVGNNVPGVQTGGSTTVGTDTRGISEKTADAITGDNVDDKTGGRTY